MGLVNVRLPTSSWRLFISVSLPHHILPLTPQKWIPPFHPVSAGGTSASAGSTICVHDLETSIFSSHPQLTQSFTRDLLTHIHLSLSHSKVNCPLPYILCQPFFPSCFFLLLSFLRNWPFTFFITYVINLLGILHCKLVKDNVRNYLLNGIGLFAYM